MVSERFSLSRHLWALTPLALFVAALFVCIGGEDAIAAYFKRPGETLRALRGVLVALTTYGNIPFYAMFAYVAVLSRGVSRRDGLYFVACYILVLVLLMMTTDILKLWVGRPRPGVAGEYIFLSLEKAKHSFPSNHVTETTFTVLALAHYCRKRPFTLVCGVWIAVMGATRVCLGRHHPTDLLGSALLGSAAVYFLYWLAAYSPLPRLSMRRRGGKGRMLDGMC